MYVRVRVSSWKISNTRLVSTLGLHDPRACLATNYASGVLFVASQTGNKGKFNYFLSGSLSICHRWWQSVHLHRCAKVAPRHWHPGLMRGYWRHEWVSCHVAVPFFWQRCCFNNCTSIPRNQLPVLHWKDRCTLPCTAEGTVLLISV